MDRPPAGYGQVVRTSTSLAIVLSVLLAACFEESGLRDEAREANRAIDALIGEVEDEEAVREAADRARDAVEEADAALRAFRENPNAETRQAVEDAERRLDAAGEALDRSLEDVPEAVRRPLGEVVDALERIGREIRQDLEG